jgi:hypothetical protein
MSFFSTGSADFDSQASRINSNQSPLCTTNASQNPFRLEGALSNIAKNARSIADELSNQGQSLDGSAPPLTGQPDAAIERLHNGSTRVTLPLEGGKLEVSIPVRFSLISRLLGKKEGPITCSLINADEKLLVKINIDRNNLQQQPSITKLDDLTDLRHSERHNTWTACSEEFRSWYQRQLKKYPALTSHRHLRLTESLSPEQVSKLETLIQITAQGLQSGSRTQPSLAEVANSLDTKPSSLDPQPQIQKLCELTKSITALISAKQGWSHLATTYPKAIIDQAKNNLTIPGPANQAITISGPGPQNGVIRYILDVLGFQPPPRECTVRRDGKEVIKLTLDDDGQPSFFKCAGWAGLTCNEGVCRGSDQSLIDSHAKVLEKIIRNLSLTNPAKMLRFNGDTELFSTPTRPLSESEGAAVSSLLKQVIEKLTPVKG